MATAQLYVTLNTGARMPSLAFGTVLETIDVSFKGTIDGSVDVPACVHAWQRTHSQHLANLESRPKKTTNKQQQQQTREFLVELGEWKVVRLGVV